MRIFDNAFFILLILNVSCREVEIPTFSLEANPQEPELFGPGVISTPLYERDIAISPNGDEIIYTLGDYRQTHRCLVAVKKQGGIWAEGQILPFSGRYNDIEPFFTVDGKRLFFASDRPLGANSTRTDYNIWVVDRKGASWDDPMPLDTLINTEKDEFYPSLGANGNLFFTAAREDGIGREDIFLSTFSGGKYQSPVALDTTVNSATYEFNAYVSPDEDLLIFSSYGRADDLGGGDLYYSRKDSTGHWSKSRHMEAGINSAQLDYCPFVDFGRGNFYYTSESRDTSGKKMNTIHDISDEANQVLNGMGNIYRVSITSLHLE